MRTQLLRRALLRALLAIVMAAVLAAQATMALAALPAPGQIDPTFAGFGGGITGFLIENRTANTSSMLIQPDGKIVTTGFSGTSNELRVFRYVPNGLRDLTFGVAGRVSFPGLFTASKVALQSDGKIVVGGTRNNDFHVARLTATGALDSSFDGDGWFADIDNQLSILSDIIVQADGKIVACGDAKVGGDADFGIARYLTDGRRDTGFSGDGKLTVPFGDEDVCESVVQQPDGKLVVAGSRDSTSILGDNDFAVARILSSGTLDSTFDGDGKLTTGFGGDEDATDAILQPDGKIVVLGTPPPAGGNKSFMARYLPSGKLDSTFDGDGKRSIPVDRLTALALQPDGKFLAMGAHTSPDGDRKFALYRLLSNSALDSSFDFDGVAWYDFGGRDIGADVAVQPDGRILFAGAKDNTAVLARVWQDGTNFDTGGQQVQSVSFGPLYPPGSYATAFALATQADGKLLTAGELRNKAGTAAEAIITRFSPDGQLDRTFAVEGSAHLQIGGFTSARAMAIQPDGKIVIAGYSSTSYAYADFMVARYLPTGAPDSSFGLNGTNYRVANFQAGEGVDKGTAVALAPDGKIVVVGSAWNGSAWVWGVARWNSNGTPDTIFDNDGLLLLATGSASGANAVVVMPDKRIIVGGNSGANDFAVGRLLENGALDASFGEYRNGYSILDMGGNDGVTALALAADGRIYAAGYTYQPNVNAFVVAQYTPNGVLTSCPVGQACGNWPDGKRYITFSGADQPYAIALRGDNQLVVAGCSSNHMAAAQMSTTAIDQPIRFQVDFAGNVDCAYAVQFTGANKDKIVLAGQQNYDSLSNIALARFQTTVSSSVSTALAPENEPATQESLPANEQAPADQPVSQETAIPATPTTPTGEQATPEGTPAGEQLPAATPTTPNIEQEDQADTEQ
jgi:uncharacterized delta-60 repeat protein